MSIDPISNKSALVQVMAVCHHETSHYMNQCWPSFVMSCDITELVNIGSGNELTDGKDVSEDINS